MFSPVPVSVSKATYSLALPMADLPLVLCLLDPLVDSDSEDDAESDEDSDSLRLSDELCEEDRLSDSLLLAELLEEPESDSLRLVD